MEGEEKGGQEKKENGRERKERTQEDERREREREERKRRFVEGQERRRQIKRNGRAVQEWAFGFEVPNLNMMMYRVGQ